MPDTGLHMLKTWALSFSERCLLVVTPSSAMKSVCQPLPVLLLPAASVCLPVGLSMYLCVCVCLSVYVVAGGAEALAAAGTTLLRAAKASLHPALKLLGDLAAH